MSSESSTVSSSSSTSGPASIGSGRSEKLTQEEEEEEEASVKPTGSGPDAKGEAPSAPLSNTKQSERRSAMPALPISHVPQAAPGASAAVGHTIENSIPLSIFPIAADKFAICVCGLPGVGKTHIARRLGRYLSFFHAVPVQVFNASEYRRRLVGLWKDATCFNFQNAEAVKKLEEVHNAVIGDMVAFLDRNTTGVAIFDSGSSNATHAKRADVMQKLHSTGARVLWIEVFNSREQGMCPYGSPDYAGATKEEAEKDYRMRVENYKRIYEEIDSGKYPAESRWTYLKCDHSRQHFILHKVTGYLPHKMVHFVINHNTSAHEFYLSRHGQSEYNAIGRIGGDSGLSLHGQNYAKKLGVFAQEKIMTTTTTKLPRPARLWTSTMRRTKETAQYIPQQTLVLKDQENQALEYKWTSMRPRAWHHLDELFAGVCDGMTYEEIEKHYPDEFARRSIDKLAYRYPRGESYLDVIARLEPIIIEMERHREPLLIVGHQGILRIIYAFYMGLTRAQAPYVSIPLNCVVQLEPSAFHCHEERHILYTPTKALPTDGQDEPINKYEMMTDPQSH
uniref:6-phosphofructo-2-kinase / fructose-2,6-bisphosphatase n=1 Tax=Nannochloropsis gaditana (strain CCMP526) TaxID=1093141 RepID=I2CQU3_NANGC